VPDRPPSFSAKLVVVGVGIVNYTAQLGRLCKPPLCRNQSLPVRAVCDFKKGVRCVDGSQDVYIPKEVKKDCYLSSISTFER
jgi:hypothetical protein